MFEVNAKIIKGIGKKSGKEYVRVEIPITPDYTKVVFLDDVERALFKVTYEK